MKVQSKEMLTAIAQHKERRRREQQKISEAVPVSRCSDWESGERPQESEMAPALHDPAPLYPDWRVEELAEKYAPRDAYEQDDIGEF